MDSLPELGLHQPDADAAPVAWVLHDGKAGMRSQALGLAEATGFRIVEKPLTIRAPWSLLPPQLWPLPSYAVAGGRSLLAPPWPDVVIGCGRNTVLPALAIRRASGGRTVAAQVQDPRLGRDAFDLLLVPEHDRLRGPCVVTTRGALHRVTPARLLAARRRFPALERLPRPILGVLIGGSNRSYRLPLDAIAEIGDTIVASLKTAGGSAVVTPSRRTGEAGLAVLRDKLKGLPATVWDMTGDNPYFAYLAVADAFLVTADSISMISEAAATGRPVHILRLAGGDAKFARFHKSMQDAGITRLFAGRIEHWDYAPLDDTARAATAVRTLVLERLAARPET